MCLIYVVRDFCMFNSLPDSVNELLKIKDELTKERDAKLSDIAKVGVFPLCKLIMCVFHF